MVKKKKAAKKKKATKKKKAGKGQKAPRPPKMETVAIHVSKEIKGALAGIHKTAAQIKRRMAQLQAELKAEERAAQVLLGIYTQDDDAPGGTYKEGIFTVQRPVKKGK